MEFFLDFVLNLLFDSRC